jgi:hypothetical protein
MAIWLARSDTRSRLVLVDVGDCLDEILGDGEHRGVVSSDFAEVVLTVIKSLD